MRKNVDKVMNIQLVNVGALTGRKSTTEVKV